VRSTRRGVTLAPDAPVQALSDSLLGSQLESILQSCTSREERLQRVLQLLVAHTGAENGFLYSMVDGAPALCATSDGLPPPTDIETLAPRYLETEISRDEGDTTATSQVEEPNSSAQWTSKEGKCYRPVLLNHQGPGGFVISGLAVLTFRQGHPLRVVAETATQISRIAVEHGDLPAYVIAV
jgi:hypothetical protein